MQLKTPNYSESFFTEEELKLSQEFLEKGYLIIPAEDLTALNQIRDAYVNFATEYLKIEKPQNADKFLNEIAKHVSPEKLNDLRLAVFNKFNALPWARAKYFSLARRTLEILIGNELVMQKRVNLSIQMPNDDSSLLPVHSDVWSGDSPFELVLWVPIVNCYKTKSMFLLPPQKDAEFCKKFAELSSKSAEDLYQMIEPHLIWLDIPYGSVLVFSHVFMHGNRVNLEPETRWSMNCRFKSLFSPFWDKRLADFFEPITIRPATRIGMEYKLPTGFEE